MRMAIDLAVCGAVFLIFFWLFRSAGAAFAAGVITSGAAHILLWDAKRR